MKERCTHSLPIGDHEGRHGGDVVAIVKVSVPAVLRLDDRHLRRREDRRLAATPRRCRMSPT